ncbi:MAG: hypothetical protein AB8G77_09140 [Rhodothermales bacterium]
MKLRVIAMTSLLVFCLGCKGTTTIDMSKQQKQIELSEEAKQEIEQIVRKVVREELANTGQSGSPTVSDVLQDVKAKGELAQVEDKKKNAEQLVMTGLRIASDAQAWLRKPAPFGGPALVDGQRPKNFNGISLSLDRLGYPLEQDSSYATLNGRFEIELIEGSETLTIYGRNELHKNLVVIKVAGLQVSSINTEIQNLP